MKLKSSLSILLNEFLYKCKKKDVNYDIAKVMIECSQEIQDIKISEISYRSNATDSSVTKFCKKLGYSGFSELKDPSDGYDAIASHRNRINVNDYGEYLSRWCHDTCKWYAQSFSRICTGEFEALAERVSRCKYVSVITPLHGFVATNIFASLMNYRKIIVFEINRDAENAIIADAYQSSEMVFVISLTGSWYESHKNLLDPKKTVLISYHICENTLCPNVALDVIPDLFSTHFRSSSALILFFTALDAAVSAFQNRKVE